MIKVSVKRMLAAAVLGLAVMVTAVVAPSVATGQGGSPVVGTWESTAPDGSGGTNHTWFTFGGRWALTRWSRPYRVDARTAT